MSGVLVVASLPHWLPLRALPPPFYLFVSADNFQPRARSALSKQNNKSKFYFYFLISFCFKTTNSSVLFLPCFCCSSEKQTVVSRLLFSCSPVRLVEVLSFNLSTSPLILVLHFHFFFVSIYFSTLNSSWAVARTEAGETFDWREAKLIIKRRKKCRRQELVLVCLVYVRVQVFFFSLTALFSDYHRCYRLRFTR